MCYLWDRVVKKNNKYMCYALYLICPIIIIYLCRSLLLQARPFDFSPGGFSNWRILTMELWDENPIGEWELTVRNAGRRRSPATRPLTFKGWKLFVFGRR